MSSKEPCKISPQFDLNNVKKIVQWFEKLISNKLMTSLYVAGECCVCKRCFGCQIKRFSKHRSPLFNNAPALINDVLQVTMSQAAHSDTDPSVDITSPPTEPPQTDPGSCQDVRAVIASPPAPLQSPLIQERVALPELTAEAIIADTTTGETSESPADQQEPLNEHQVVECDQPVSLEPEAEDNFEVCSIMGVTLFLNNLNQHFGYRSF